MNQGFRQSQAGLHTWSGLLVGWILYPIFLNGAVSYWRDEITRWAQPEIGAFGASASAKVMVAIRNGAPSPA